MKIVHVYKRTVKLRRGKEISTSGNVEIVVYTPELFDDEFIFASLHYGYGYTDNATQWSMAEKIAKMAFGEDVEITRE
jgi:hypothetical protein